MVAPGPWLIDTAEIYDPATGTFKLLESKMSVPRQYHNIVKLLDGTVLVVGGSRGPGLKNVNTKVDRFDPVTETFTFVGETHAPVGCNACASVLRDGRVILSGSYDDSVSPAVVSNDADIYDPETNSFTKITGPAHGQTDILSVRLLDGTVMSPIGLNGKYQVTTATFLFRPDNSDFVFTDSIAVSTNTCISSASSRWKTNNYWWVSGWQVRHYCRNLYPVCQLSGKRAAERD